MSNANSVTRSSRRRKIIPAIEPLEERLMRSADLTGFFASSIPSVLEAGDRNHVAIEVSNDGDESAAGPMTAELFASGDSTGDDNVLLASVTRNVNLKAGRDGKFNFRFAEPATLADGTYSLIASVDSNGNTNAGASNSAFASSTPVTVQRPLADLTAEKVVAPTQPIFINGDMVQGQPASMTLVNRGTGAADGVVSVDFYLSTGTTLDSQSLLVGGDNDVSINLRPGGSKAFRTDLEPSVNTPGGAYYLFAVATPVAGIDQKNVGDEVGLAPRLVQIILTEAVATSTNEPGKELENTYPGAVIECSPGGTGTVCPPPTPASNNATTCAPSSGCDNSASACTPPACDPTTDSSTQSSCDDSGTQSGDSADQQADQDQSTDDNSQSTDDSSQSSDGSDQSTTDPSSQSSDNSSGDDSSSTDAGAQDTSSQQSDDSGDSGDSSSVDSSDSGSDDSGDSGDAGSDDSGDSGSDDSGDSGSDDSGDDSGDDSDDSADLLRATRHAPASPTSGLDQHSSNSHLGKMSHK